MENLFNLITFQNHRTHTNLFNRITTAWNILIQTNKIRLGFFNNHIPALPLYLISSYLQDQELRAKRRKDRIGELVLYKDSENDLF